MKKSKQPNLRLVLFLLLFSGTSFGQVWNSMIATNTSTICSEGESLLIDFSTVLTDDIDLEIQLGTGMEYVPSSLVLSGATLVTDNTTDSNNPKFTLNLSSGAVTVEFNRVGGCAAQDHQIAGGIFNDVAQIFQSGVQQGSDGISNNYQVQYASLSITGLSNSPTTASVGTTVTRSMTINNGSFGFVSEFSFAEIFTSGDLSFSNFVINPAGVNYLIPSGNINLSSGGDSLIVSFNQAEINNITNTGSDTDLFEQGETFVLQYDMTLNTCGISNNVESTQSVYWGCNDTPCQGYSQISNIPLLLGQPILNVTSSIGTIDQCYGYDNGSTLYTFKIINTGTGPGIVDKTQIQFNYGYVAGYDPANVVYNFNGGTDIPIAATTTLGEVSGNVGCNLGFGADLVANEEWENLPIIPAGDTLELKFELYTCCPSSCAPFDFTRSIQFGGMIMRGMTYSNQCGENTVVTGNVALQNNSLGFNSSNTFPANMIANDPPQNINLEFIKFSWTSSFLNTTNSYLELEVVFPGQIDFGGSGAGDISWADANGDIFIPSYADIRDDGMTIRWSALTDNTRNGGGIIFPIITDCSEVATDDILQSSFYLYPNTGCTSDCRIELDCASEALNIVCPSPCPAGINNISYRFERTNLGEIDMDNNGCPDSDNDCDGIPGGGSTPPTADDSYIRKDKAISGDTIISSVVGAIATNATYTNWDYIYYENNFDNIANWDFISATLEVYDFSTASTISIPSGTLTPIITGNQVKFDLSTTGSISSFLPAGFKFENSDTLKLDINYQVQPTSATATLLSTNNFFYTSDIANPSAPTSFECSSFIGKIYASKLILSSCCTDQLIANDCSAISTGNGINIVLNGGGAGQQTFSYEYRNLFKPTYFSYLIPDGYIYESATLKMSLATSGNTAFNQTAATIAPTNFTVNIDGSTLYEFDFTDPINSNIFTENGGNVFLSDEGFSLFPDVKISPICPKGEDSVPMSVFAGVYTSDNRTDTINDTYLLKEQMPELSMNSTNASQTINGEEVIWNLTVNNSSTSNDVSNLWIYIEVPNGNIGNNVLELSEGGVPIIPTANGIYQLGNLSSNTLKTLSIRADVAACSLDSILIKTGYNCTGYPNEITDYNCEALSFPLEVAPVPSQISTLITALAITPSDPADAASTAWGRSTIDMCDPFPIEVRIISSQPGELTDVITSLNNLLAGGGAALDFVANSAYIEYPVGTTPRAFSAAANTSLVSEIGTTQYNFDLATIDPINFDWTSSANLVPGVGDAPNNEIILRFQVASNCDLLSGDALTFSSFANRPCGEPAIGNGELVSAFVVKIDGIVEPYSMNFLTLSVDDLQGCTDQSTVVTSYEKTGSATVTSTDSLQFVLPGGTTYSGPINCVSGICPTGSPIITTVAGLQKISWQLPPLLNGQQGEFNFAVDYSGLSDCGNDIKEIQVSAVSDQSIFCGASTCPSSKISLGQTSESISYFKPILAVNYNSLIKTSGAPNQFDFDIEVENNGTLTTSSPIKIDFYEYNSSTHNIMGSSLASINSSEALGAGDSEQLTGSFATLEELSNGVVAIIDRGESQNCSCPDFSGINNNPAAVMSAILPVELSMFRGEVIDCEVQLTWKSETETVFSHYELEKSRDGRNFETVENIKGSGGSVLSQTYEYLDEVIFEKSYYRLKMVDLDESTAYSDLLVIETDCKEDHNISIYPNPVGVNEGLIHVEFYADDSETDLMIVNLVGEAVKKVSLSTELKWNTMNLDIAELPVGVYFIKQVGSNRVKRFLIQ